MATAMEVGSNGLQVGSLRAILDRAYDAVSVRRVFGEPLERDGMTIFPAAVVAGGGGGGGGDGPGVDRTGEGRSEMGTPISPAAAGVGGGFGLLAWPAGVYVIAGGRVRWRPAVNVNLIVLGGQIVAVVAFLTAGACLRQWLQVRGRTRSRWKQIVTSRPARDMNTAWPGLFRR
jgi:uncharacterized spore protein YtfJ